MMVKFGIMAPVFAAFGLIVAFLTTACIADGAQFPLDGRSFGMKSAIKPVLPFGVSKILRVIEDYSFEQKRAKVQYFSTLGDDGLKTFYYNDNSMLGIQYKVDSSSEDTCKKTSTEEFNQQFYRDFKGFGAAMSNCTLQKAGHVVGPTKLLFMIAARSGQMKRVSTDSTKFVYTGAQDLIQYDLETLPGFSLIHVYYDAASFSIDPSPETQLPKLITIPSFYVVIYYSALEIHPDEGTQSERMDTKKIQVDRFAFPTSDKCFGQLPEYDMFLPYGFDVFKVSFVATSEDAMNVEEEHLVEFDGLRQVMRVDKHNYGTGHSTSDIFDLRTDRRYLVWEEKIAQEPECIMVKGLGDRRSSVKMAELLVGGRKYSLLGRAKVRGIDALVYSVPALNLPFWYDKPVLHRRDGIEWLRHRGHSVYNTERGHIAGYYTLVYVNEAVEEGVKLLAMEVMQANSMHVLTVHFYDFVWHLSEPANGMQIDGLFSPVEACSAGSRDDNYVDVSILLEQDEPSNKTQRLQANWAEDWPQRDAALLASLADSLEIDVTMIHDFESTLVQTNSRYKIDVNFRLSERPLLLHELNYVGGASMRPQPSNDSAELLIKRDVQTLRDCLDLVDPADKLNYIYYSEQESICIVDLSLSGKEENELHLLDLLTPKGKPSIGELYRVNTRKDSVSYMTTLLRDETVLRLEGRLLVLTHTRSSTAMPIDPVMLEVRIKHMKLKNVNFLQRAKNRGPGRGMRAGYALVPTTATAEESSGTYVVASSDENGGLKRLSDCQTACTVDPNCESFSFCVYFPETECTLSNGSYQLIELEIDQLDEPDQESNATRIQEHSHYKLHKDFRCEIHRNHHLDYFFSKAEPYVTLSVFDVVPTNNSEECARDCIQRTIAELQEQVELQHTMHGHSEVGLEQHAEFIDQYKERMRRVCQQFHYIRAPTVQVNRDVVKYHLEPELKPVADTNTGGYCLFDRPIPSGEDHRKDSSPYRYVLFQADLFELDFSKLYKRESGFVLSSSGTTKEEQDALVTYVYTRSEEKAEMLRGLDSQGKNLQYNVHADERRCAHMCFFQYAGLCRSFDTYQETLMGGGRINKCNLNSQSIRIYEHAGKNVEELKNTSEVFANTWHYELKWDLLVRPLARRQSDVAAGGPAASLGGFAVFLVVVASLVSGLLFGLKLGQRLSPRRRLPSIPIIVQPETNSPSQQEQQLGYHE